MKSVPANPKIYHITHINNLKAIASKGKLVSDAIRIAQDIDCSEVGMATIKRRRLEEIEVTVHPGTKVGQYVPFYFCLRSVMLYLIYRGNHPGMTYQGGQENIIHLQADFHEVVKRANAKPHPWAFSNGNAGAYLSRFFNQVDRLDEIDWTAVSANNFREPQIKEKKQAEFLTFNAFPWNLIRKVGTINNTVATQASQILAGCPHQPRIEIERSWYY